MTSFILNQQLFSTDEHPGTTLLEVIRETACLSGTKEACREGECGACTVLVGTLRPDGGVDYRACASCLLPLGEVAGRHVVTVEGFPGKSLTLIQQLIVDNSASQCGFCTPGIVLSLAGFCFTSTNLSYEDALDALDGNICRCTGYVSIRNAARALGERLAKIDRRPEHRLNALIAEGVVPDYFRAIPGRLQEIKTGAPTFGKGDVLVAGGTDLFVQKPEQLRESPLSFLSRFRELSYVREDSAFLRVGGGTTIEEFRTSAAVRRHFPALEADLLLHSSAILRNKATLAGNIVNASPIGDATIILLALDARLVIAASPDGQPQDGTQIPKKPRMAFPFRDEKREIALENFFLGYKKTALACGEMVVEITIPLLQQGACYHFEKVSNRTTLDIAAVNSAMRVAMAPDGTIAELRIAAGGVGPVPLLLAGLESFRGRTPDADFVAALAKTAQDAARPIDDIRGSAEYKRLLLGQLMRGHFQTMAMSSEAV
jgi:xanthine dehydrogenase small subunit